MPATNCKGCDKTIRNPPSRKITGYCMKCYQGVKGELGLSPITGE